MYAKIGGNQAQNVADALLGNLATKFFHAQPDPRTAEWAANMIGKAVVWNPETGKYVGEATRCADVYVFCHYPEQGGPKPTCSMLRPGMSTWSRTKP